MRFVVIGLFENSVVIVMADHGHRFAKLRNTHQGQLEEVKYKAIKNY